MVTKVLLIVTLLSITAFAEFDMNKFDKCSKKIQLKCGIKHLPINPKIKLTPEQQKIFECRLQEIAKCVEEANAN